MEVYHITEDDLERIPESEVDYEQRLEEQLVRSHGATIADERLLYIAQQGDPSGDQTSFDLVAVDEDGNTIILELKRGRSPRDVVAQALDYASGLRNAEYDQLADWYQEFRTQNGIETPPPEELQEAHAEYFDLDESLSEREFNQGQRLLLLADDFDDKTLAVADFLREHDIDVICVVHQTFKANAGPHLLTTEAVRRPIDREPTGTESRPGTDEPTTESAKNRVQFWGTVKDTIGNRSGSPLRDGWTPQNETDVNLAFPGDQVPLQAACKSRSEVVEMRLVIRNDRELFEELASKRDEVESALKAAFDGDLGTEWESEWIQPDETNAERDRSKIIWRRPITLDDESSRRECAEWTVDAAEAFYDIFRTKHDVRSMT
ncbi:DUF4268 domain-containing protein [haloarchaeon 3A1-DGR]|nr:DUF4268 domain-containing protein [haloarchaeon 3A1-DGR]